MQHVFNLSIKLGIILILPISAVAKDIMIEKFERQPETRWSFITDGVMGGVSTGTVTFLTEDNQTYAHMTGNVSTENNGGFIQMRMELPAGASEDATGVRLFVRGNEQLYFVHLRTSGTVLPWHYYQAGFDVTSAWKEVKLPFDAFKRSNPLLGTVLHPNRVKSIAIVAYGRNHAAEIDTRQVGFY